MPLQEQGQERPGHHHSPATPPIPSTGSSPFQLPDTPTPATGYPAINMGTPVQTPAGFGTLPSPPTGSLPPPPAGSLPPPLSGGLFAPSIGPSSGNLFGPPRGSPQVNLEMLQNEHKTLASKINGARDWAGYVTIPHTDIMRYIELSNILNSNRHNTQAQGQAGPSNLSGSINAEKTRLAELEESICDKEQRLIQIKREQAPLEKRIVEAKASLKSVEESLEEKNHELAALQPREAELTRREIEVLERKAALDEREELLKAGEDGLEQQEEENMAYAAKLIERENLANAALEKEKLIDSEKASLQQQKEDLEKENKTMNQVNKALVNKDMALDKRKKDIEAKEAEITEQEAKIQQEVENIEKVKAFLRTTGAGQQAQYQEFEKKKAAFLRQHRYQSLPAQPSDQARQLLPPQQQQASLLQPPQQQQASLIQAPQQQVLSLAQPIPQAQPDTSQRVALGYQYGWDAAFPVGVENGRRKASAHTSTLHIKHHQAVITRIRQIIHNHNQIMAGPIKIDLNALQKEIDELIQLERNDAEEVEMTFEEKFGATTKKDGSPVWEYIRTMGIEAGCPVYFYWPAHPNEGGGGAPTAGIIRPAPPNSTPQSLGVTPVVVVGGNNPPNNQPNNQWLAPSARASTPLPLPLPGPGPNVPTIQVTTPGGTDRAPTASPPRRIGAGKITMKVNPSSLAGFLQVAPRNYTKRARANSASTSAAATGEPAPKRPRGRPRKYPAMETAPAPARVARPTTGGLRLLAPAPAQALPPVITTIPATAVYTASAFALAAPAPAPPAPAAQENPPVGGAPSQQEEADEDEEDEGEDEEEDKDAVLMYLAELWGWMGPRE